MKKSIVTLALALVIASTAFAQDASIDELRKSAESGNAKAQYDLGRRYQRAEGVERDYEAAAKWYEKAAAQGYSDAQYSLGMLYRRGSGVTKDEAKGNALINKAAEQGNTSALSFLANVSYNRASEYHNKGDYDKALSEYSQAIKYNPKYTDAYLNRGIAYMGKGNPDNAIADLTQAVKLEPKSGVAYYYRGALYSEKKDNDRAIADYTKAIEIGLDNTMQSSAYNNRGWAYFLKGDYDRAIADCTQSIKLDSKNTYAYDSRGEAYFKKGDYDRSIADYSTVFGIDADHNVKTINDNLATIASTASKTEQKIAALETLTGCKALIPVARLTSADKTNPKMPYSNVGAAVYKELAAARFLNTAAAVSKYETMLTFITGRGNAARAEIEAFYRQNVGAQFNRVEFGLYNYGKSALTRNANNQYILTCESAANPENGVKTLPASSLETLLSEMRKNAADFRQSDIDTVRAQAALIPALKLAPNEIAAVKEILADFYLSPGGFTYNRIRDVVAIYNIAMVSSGSNNAAYANAAGSYVNTISMLSGALGTRIVNDVIKNPVIVSPIAANRPKNVASLLELRQR